MHQCSWMIFNPIALYDKLWTYGVSTSPCTYRLWFHIFCAQYVMPVYTIYIRYNIYFISGRKRIPIATFRKSQVPMLVVLLLNIYICPTPSLCHCCAWAPNVPIAPFVAAWRRRSSAPRTGCGKSGDCGCRPNCQICRWWHGVFLRFLTKGHRCICMKE